MARTHFLSPPGHYGPRLELVLKTGGFGGVTKLYLEKLVLSRKTARMTRKKEEASQNCPVLSEVC